MAKRRYEVEVTGTIFIEIDDEVKSDYSGQTLMHIHKDGSRWAKERMTHKDAIGAAALTVGLYGSRDGYADFPDSAIFATTRDFQVTEVTAL